tara:strand:+ start:5174 stop:7720 length:2547 start_codon:yes stop_codon:yes gene_type:complete
VNNWILLILLHLPLLGITQSKTDRLDIGSLNYKLLEQSILDQINQIRVNNGKTKLYPDSLLLETAQNQSNYLAISGNFSHYQKINKSLRDPQLRSEFFGADEMMIGENILFLPVGSKSLNSKLRGASATYSNYAHEIAELWLSNVPDKSNLNSDEYAISAVSIKLNETMDTLFVVQVFGAPIADYEYVRSKTSFPYSTLDGNKSMRLLAPKIKSPKKYPYGIKTPQRFSDCPKPTKKRWMEVDASLTITRDKMLFCVYELNQVRRFFSGPKDGLAVELISFENQFNCDGKNVEQANTRNGFSYLDGRLMKPVYRNEIEKQRLELQEKASKQKSNSEEKNCNYFKLGKTPENFTDYPYEVKLHYIRNKKFCVQVEFDLHCGELLVYKPATLPVKYTIDTVKYVPVSRQTSLTVDVGFEKNAVEFNGADMEELLVQLKNKEFLVNSIRIDAFSSIEGTRSANEKLFKKRAEVLVAELEKHQKGSIKYTLKSQENWDLFYKQVDTTEYYSMKVWKRDRVKQYFKDSVNAIQFKPFFKDQRKAKITLTITPVQNNKWKQLMARTEWNSIMGVFNQSGNIDDEQLQRLDIIQCYLQRVKVEDKSLVDPQELVIPQLKEFSKANYRNYLFGIQNGKTYDAAIAVEKLKKWNSKLQEREVDYNIKAIIANHSDEFSSKEKIILIRSLVSELKAQEAKQELIDDVEMWFHIEMANLVYGGHEVNYVKKAMPSLNYIKSNYCKKDSSYSRKMELAKYYISFEQYDWAKELLLPYVEGDNIKKEAMALYLKYCLSYELENFPASYYIELKKAYEIFPKKQWCRLFIGNCKIPLRALDWPSTRALYCASCSELIGEAKK